MILTPHAIIGAAVSNAFPGYPILGFASFVNNFKALYQLLMICLDFFFGLFLAVLIFSRDWNTLIITLLGVAGGVLPDFLRFFYYKYKKEPFVSLAKFHDIFESKNCLDHKPIIGSIIQITTTVVFVLLSFYIKSRFAL